MVMDDDIDMDMDMYDADADMYMDEPDPEPSPEEIFEMVIRSGETDKFLNMINDGFTSSRFNHPQDFLAAVCTGSIDCASLLINGETRLAVDVRSPCRERIFPLHLAARMESPDITELLLVNNAQTSVRCHDHDCFTLPLHFALRSDAMFELKDWTPENSINQLLFSLCLPRMQDALENVGLLAWTTKYTEEEFLRYVKGGQVVEVAALMIVAWKKLRDLTMTARSMLTQSEVRVSRDRRTAMLQLFDVFDTAGDDLESYVKRPKLFVSNTRAITAVKYLLQQNGFRVKQEETDLSYLRRYEYFRFYNPLLEGNFDYWSCLPEDAFMEHYGKSGYRWTRYQRLLKIVKKLDTYLSPSSPKTETTNASTIEATLSSIFPACAHFEVLNKVKDWRFNFPNVVSRMP